MLRRLEETARPRVRPLTYAGYKVNICKHIIPALGKLRLDKVRPAEVQAMLNDLLEAGFSSKTVTYVRMVLRTALADAVRWGDLSYNVVDRVDPPRQVRKAIAPLDPAESRRFLEAIRGHRLEALFTVALALGLRQGEALGLLWENVNLDEGYLTVRYQLQKIDHELRLVEPKTDRSRRTIVLPPTIVESLREHRDRQAVERQRAGSAWKEGDFVFTHADGSPLDARHAIHHFHRALKVAGIPRRRFHDLRHSCATLLLIQGVSPRVVMDLLGHSEIAMTMNTYSHVVPELRREAADRMEAILANGNGDRTSAMSPPRDR